MENLNINLNGFATPEEVQAVAKGLTTLAAYAELKAKAMHDRANGFINEALTKERFCEILYNKLPEWARW